MTNKTLLITGCSTGIGYASAHYFHERGYRVLATVRRPDDQIQLEKMGITTFLLDLNESESIATLVDTLQSRFHIDVLINNAGYGQCGALEEISRDQLREQFETNVFGLAELTNAIIPLMRQQGGGRIINISSVLGLAAMPFRGAYNASKYAVEALSDTWRLELADSAIDVSLIEPGPIRSAFRDTAAKKILQNTDTTQSRYHKHYEILKKGIEEPILFQLEPEAVAKKIEHAITATRPKTRYFVTWATYLMVFAKRCLPTRWFDQLLLRLK